MKNPIDVLSATTRPWNSASLRDICGVIRVKGHTNVRIVHTPRRIPTNFRGISEYTQVSWMSQEGKKANYRLIADKIQNCGENIGLEGCVRPKSVLIIIS